MAGDPLCIFITQLDASGTRRCGVKDLFDTAGVVTTYGSRIYRDHVPDRDAAAWARLRDGGWSLAGKTNLHEFAYGVTSQNPWYGSVRNPHDPERVAGGSSGGSAAGVAAGAFELGLGTDTAGSIRIPASACGVVGFKPSFGAVPLEGCFPLVPWLDTAGPIASTAAGCSEAFSVLAARPAVTPASPEGLVIGVMRRLVDVDPSIAAVYAASIDRLREAGAQIVDCALPWVPDGGVFLRMVRAAYEHRVTFPARASEYAPDVRVKLERGLEPLSHLEALGLEAELSAWRARCYRLAAGVQLVAMPTLPDPPPRLDAVEGAVRGRLVRHTQLFNYLGWAAISVPCGRDARGLPVGLQLAAADDTVVLGAALGLESAIRG